jgi:hypothetical protein
MKNEIWKPVKGYEGIYKVSNLGKVKSLKFGKERLLKAGITSGGYAIVVLSKNKKQKNKYVHQLVAESFLNHVPDGLNLVIDHINDIKTDNRVYNLQIVTNRFNVKKTQGKYSSIFKGVYWHKSTNKWASSIWIDGKRKHLGSFVNEFDASQAYQSELLKLNKIS